MDPLKQTKGTKYVGKVIEYEQKQILAPKYPRIRKKTNPETAETDAYKMKHT